MKKSELEKEFNKCWGRMLDKSFHLNYKDKLGFAIMLRDLHIFGKDFKKDLFKEIEDMLSQNKQSEVEDD